MSDDFFSMDIPDLQGLIKQLDMFDENQNKAVRKALHKIGKNIQQAQRQIILSRKVGKKLAKHIKSSRVYVTKKGELGISRGYYDSETDDEGFNPLIVGMANEFGRPGQSSSRRQDKKRWWHYKSKTGKTVYMVQEKGAIQPLSHIRAGFDETLEQNVQLMVDAVNEVIDKTGGGT